MKKGRFVQLAESDRDKVSFFVDGEITEALAGDTIMTAILKSHRQLRRSEFGDGNRAGFCLMGSCQDCWVSTEDGKRLRACSTEVSPDIRICTTKLVLKWPGRE